MMTQIKSG